MRLTPWMLTIATFGMVLVITVSYFFKHSESLGGWLADGPTIGRATSRPFRVSYPPPQVPIRPVTMPEDPGADPAPPADTKPLTKAGKTNEEPGDPEPMPSVEPPYDPGTGVPVDVVDSNTNEPVDGMFEESPPAFVTEQYRSVERTEVSFVEERRISRPRVSSASSGGVRRN